MNITPNFKIEEFACKDGTPYPMEWIFSRLKHLCEALEEIRESCKKEMETKGIKFIGLHINSGYRSPAYNKKVGGVLFSQHTQGKAADIVCPGLTPEEVGNNIEVLAKSGKIPYGGHGTYPTFNHYDIREGKARWRG